MNIYLMVWDSDDGTEVHQFKDEAQRDQAIYDRLLPDWDEGEHGPAPSHYSDLWDKISLFASYWIVAHVIDISALFTVNEAWKRCKDAPGTFGALYDADEIFTALDGNDEFDPQNEEDRQAVQAWCEEHGPDLEEAFSETFWANTPTRGEAFKALTKKRTLSAA